MTRESLEAKAARLLAAGRLRVLQVDARQIRATCQGDSGKTYRLGWWRGSFGCSCPAGQLSRADCAHLLALKRVVAAPDQDDAASGLTPARLLEEQREASRVRAGSRRSA
jgi:uncharacterized Zn finger protein